MARSTAQRAEDRAAMYAEQIRAALAEGDSRKALRRAHEFLLGEAAKRRDRNPGEGALVAAAVAGALWHLAADVPAYPPQRPRGGWGAVRPDDLLAEFAARA